MYKKILVPTDGSEFAQKAEKHALFLAKTTGADIYALSVTENFVNELPLDDEVYQLNQLLKQRSEDNIKEFEEMDETSGIKFHGIIREGSPAKTILEVAKEEDIDLIVIGSSGKSGFDRFIMGSVAEKVVNAAKCAVLVIH